MVDVMQHAQLTLYLPTKSGLNIDGGDAKHAKVLSTFVNFVSIGLVTACPRHWPHM